ncbi:MarR family winged helix-turn-helix transcriptional regulator [Methylobacterium sp. J-090]|uniref:MarR family winged helix-turn-helix transcriptional regulator n=1 Tax=Methylobacterium sp. J-090 TaxID=2836666 RepID=UPI001FBAE058|nr:MarR family transcriptional regulator [Methylobacterium sp. J-090]MCJ2082103.1 MarR family transcriptional regulator [Methylobacterium sp. J-090]
MSDTDPPTFQTRSAGYLANQMARLFAQALAEAIRPMGLAPAQFMVLLELWREEGLAQTDLVARADVEQATMASTLARMERDGLILRTPHPEDSRAQVIRLTPRARSLEADAVAAARAVNGRALAGFGEAEAALFLAQMRRVVVGLRNGRIKSTRRRVMAISETEP